MIMNPLYEPIARAVRIVAGKCDGAVQQDGHGFNGGDAEFGRSLAEKDFWSEKQAICAQRLILKYAKQYGSGLAEEIRAIKLGEPQQNPAQTNPASAAPILTGRIDVETLLKWGEPQTIDTRGGLKTIRKAKPDERFWNLWRERKEELKNLGLTVYKNGNDFEVTLWPPRNETSNGPSIV